METLSKVWNFVKGLPGAAWEVLVVVISLLIAITATKKKHTAEVERDAAQADGKDAVLAEKQNSVHQQDANVVKEGEEKKAEVPNKTPDQLAKDLNNV